MMQVKETRASHRASEGLSLDATFESAKILAGAADPVSQMPKVLQVLESFMGLRHCVLALLSEPEEGAEPVAVPARNPWVIAATARSSELRDLSCGAIPEKLAMKVFRTGIPMVALDVADEFGADAVPPEAEDGDLSVVAVPIREPNGSPLVLGVLCAFRARADNAAGEIDNDLRVMRMIGALLEQSLRFRRTVARDRERILADARNAYNTALGERNGMPALTQIDTAGIVGDSPAITAVIERIRRVASTSASVLLRGESGTGKELFARALHAMSDRREMPFVSVNCAALSESLLETELFGHEKGAFTGAVTQKKGRFELADRGTLFLDEIGEISLEFQAKLLRVLQENEFERVGGTRTLKVDVRLVSATNRDLETAVARGKFRADLYFRICVVPIILPPLRDRPSDIRALARAFLDRFNSKNNTRLTMADDALSTMSECKFPGNVRDLENCVNRVAALSAAPVITASDMACHQDACLSKALWRIQSGADSPIGGLAVGHAAPSHLRPIEPAPASPPSEQARKTANTEREDLIDAMERAGWVQAKAARILGMTPRQIGYALKKHNVSVQKF